MIIALIIESTNADLGPEIRRVLDTLAKEVPGAAAGAARLTVCFKRDQAIWKTVRDIEEAHDGDGPLGW